MYGKPCAHHAGIHLSLPVTDVELESWIADIYKKSIDAGLHIPSVKAYANKYLKALTEGYGDISNIDYNTPDDEMIRHLKENIYSFSFAKNRTELKALTEMLQDGAGKLRSFSEFKKLASGITGQFRGSWLEAEYELAVAGSQMASKWVEFEKTGDDTLLKYSTVKDARVSDICKPLEGIIKPINDAFWNTYYPPNHFRCRCDVDRLVNGTVTPNDKIEMPTIPKMLRVNLAKEKLLFPKDHPYFNVPPTNLKTNKANILSSNLEMKIDAYEKNLGITIDRNIFQLLKQDVEFTNIKYKGKGAFYIQPPPRVNIPFDARRKNSKWYAEAVVYHEFGHAIEFKHALYKHPKVTELMSKYRKIFGEKNNHLYAKIDDRLHRLGGRSAAQDNHNMVEMVGSARDTIKALNIKFGTGHDNAYFRKIYNNEHEFLAHMFENKFIGNPVFKKVMPELYAEMVQLANELQTEIIL